MQAQELRIGDLVHLKSKGKSFLITRGVEIDIGCESEDFEPIPLTDPLFDTIKDGDFFLFGKHNYVEMPTFSLKVKASVDRKYTPRVYFEGDYDFFYLDLAEMTYFHELQLLVKALTGKEYTDIVNQEKYF